MNPACIPELIAVSSELRITEGNEASTRFKLIDTVLQDLLGWQKTDIEVEERASEDGKTQFIDYIISAGAHSFVIEAKRIGKFANKLPQFRKGRLSDSWSKHNPLKDTINQARNYGREKSVGFCVVTDGLNWVIFPVNRRDRIPIESSLAILFSDVKFSERDIRSCSDTRPAHMRQHRRSLRTCLPRVRHLNTQAANSAGRFGSKYRDCSSHCMN